MLESACRAAQAGMDGVERRLNPIQKSLRKASRARPFRRDGFGVDRITAETFLQSSMAFSKRCFKTDALVSVSIMGTREAFATV